MESKHPTVPLGEVATVRSGHAFKSKEWRDSGIPVVKIANVKGGCVDLANCSFVGSKTAERAESATLVAGDILIAMTGYVGEVSIVRDNNLPAVLNQRVGRFHIEDNRVDRRFFYYVAASREFREEIKALGYGSAQPNVSPTLIHGVRIPLPDVRDQQKISSLLAPLDDKIDRSRRINETLEAMTRALFKSWFVDFDPVRAKMEGRDAGLPQYLSDLFPDKLVDSEIGAIPGGWRVGCVADIASSPRRAVQPEKLPAGTPYIGLEHMPRRSIALAEWEGSEKVTSGKSCFMKGEILFGKLRPYFHKVGIAPVAGVCSTDIVVIVPNNPAWRSYVLTVASSDEFVKYTDQASTGTKMPRTSWKTMGRYGLCLPPQRLAEVFQALTEPIVSRIVSGIHSGRMHAELRDTLLPKLLSGELRVHNLLEMEGTA